MTEDSLVVDLMQNILMSKTIKAFDYQLCTIQQTCLKAIQSTRSFYNWNKATIKSNRLISINSSQPPVKIGDIVSK